MIISHAHRYLFVELPRTGSTAIRRELRDHYAGQPILHKHATYQEFLRSASPEERGYFVFSAIRHPMDSVVSRYFKIRTDHRGQFAEPAADAGEPGRLNRLVDRIMFRYLRRDEVGFADYFMRYYWLPYDTWTSLSHARFDVVMRFEDLADDFARALRAIGVEPVRELPLVNATSSRKRDYRDYYPPETWARARRVFGPYMERWGYAFPEEWGIQPPTRWHRLHYRAVSRVAGMYWRHLRWRI